MTKELFNFLGSVADQTSIINKVIVSLYLDINEIEVKKNRRIKALTIKSSQNRESEVFEEAKRFLKGSCEITLTQVIHLFEKTVPEKDKTINGVVYTPDFIKEFIVENVMKDNDVVQENLLAADISCGCGGFLLSLAKTIKNKTDKSYSRIFSTNLYGLDITDYSIERTKILLSLLAISGGEDKESFKFNLFTGNALSFDWFENTPKIKNNGGFDLIVGNPPYVTKRNMNEDTKKLLKNWAVTKSGNTDLYIPFFEIGLKYLAKEGSLGYITVNTFFRSLNARLLRKLFQIKKLQLKIIDFGDEPLFGSRSTYSCICFIKNVESKKIYATSATSEDLRSSKELNYDSILYKKLDHERGWLLINGQTSKNLKKIQSTGTKFGNKFKIRTGFATLRNKVYKFKPTKTDSSFYYREFKGEEYAVEKDICKLAINPNRIKNKENLYSKSERIIFPYRRKDGKVEVISEKFLKKKYPKTYKFLEINRETLNERDKGKGDYEAWYAYGRRQSLSDIGIRLLYPHICKEPHFMICEIEDILFYNGHAVYADSKRELRVLKLILESKVFDYYLKYSSRNYSGDYISLSKNYVKHFGVCNLTEKEEEYLLSCNTKDDINSFLFKKYELSGKIE